MYVIIAGGGAIGAAVAAGLAGTDHQVLVIENRENVCKAGRQKVPVTWLWGDACDPARCSEAEMGRADIVLALTGEDEDNLVISLLAKVEFGVDKVLARVNDPANGWLFDSEWGVDIAVSSSDIVSDILVDRLLAGQSTGNK